jgi:hypothetical protein
MGRAVPDGRRPVWLLHGVSGTRCGILRSAARLSPPRGPSSARSKGGLSAGSFSAGGQRGSSSTVAMVRPRGSLQPRDSARSAPDLGRHAFEHTHDTSNEMEGAPNTLPPIARAKLWHGDQAGAVLARTHSGDLASPHHQRLSGGRRGTRPGRPGHCGSLGARAFSSGGTQPWLKVVMRRR